MFLIAPSAVQSDSPGRCVVRRVVLDAHATRVRHYDLAVVRREAVEVAVRDRDELAARAALGLRHDALRGSVREQVVGIVERGVRLAAAERAHARVAFALDDPFGFRDLAVFDLETQRVTIAGPAASSRVPT